MTSQTYQTCPGPGRRLHVFVQHEVADAQAAETAAHRIGADITTFGADPDFPRLDARAAESRPLVFASLGNANRILRRWPALARGVILPKAFLRHGTYSSLLPADMLLNSRGIYLPWGRIPDHSDMIEALFENGVFLRPNSPMKPFTGFSAVPGKLEHDHAVLSRSITIDADEMTFIAPAVDLADLEWRVWIVDGMVVTSSAYSWHTEDIDRPAPDDVIAAAARIGEHLMMREQVYTADFTVLPDLGPRLIELNALSTSGWYPGLDAATLLAALDEVMI